MSSEHRAERHIKEGSCSACGGAAERGPSGAWWHTGTPCGSIRPAALFRPREQDGPPRDRQIKDPRRTR
ncbi:MULTISPECIES: hypothetical protein [unclassified Streptomyces]|uniref:hypothetical protein n=1 Tax=unclassified Streptomyces TaxID=2593676 RepID=UPI0035D74905